MRKITVLPVVLTAALSFACNTENRNTTDRNTPNDPTIGTTGDAVSAGDKDFVEVMTDSWQRHRRPLVEVGFDPVIAAFRLHRSLVVAETILARAGLQAVDDVLMTLDHRVHVLTIELGAFEVR